ncbi:hypothetical protein P7C70_g7977, partial [Phenoliferia sp. Uapishka_3]
MKLPRPLLIVTSILVAPALGSPPPTHSGFLIASSPRAHSQFIYNPIAFPSAVDVNSRLLSSSASTIKAHARGGAGLRHNPHTPAMNTLSLSPGARVIDNDDSRITYEPASSWSTVRGSSFLSGSSHRTSSPAQMSLRRRHGTDDVDSHHLPRAPRKIKMAFTGHGIDWYGSKSPLGGQATVLLDGQAVATIDAYSPRWLDRQLLFSSSRDIPLSLFGSANVSGGGAIDLGSGRHELEVVVKGEGQRRSRGEQIDLDLVVVWEGLREGRKSKSAASGPIRVGKLEGIKNRRGSR